jgi:hypothetical protein
LADARGLSRAFFVIEKAAIEKRFLLTVSHRRPYNNYIFQKFDLLEVNII